MEKSSIRYGYFDWITIKPNLSNLLFCVTVRAGSKKTEFHKVRDTKNIQKYAGFAIC